MKERKKGRTPNASKGQGMINFGPIRLPVHVPPIPKDVEITLANVKTLVHTYRMDPFVKPHEPNETKKRVMSARRKPSRKPEKTREEISSPVPRSTAADGLDQQSHEHPALYIPEPLDPLFSEDPFYDPFSFQGTSQNPFYTSQMSGGASVNDFLWSETT